MHCFFIIAIKLFLLFLVHSTDGCNPGELTRGFEDARFTLKGLEYDLERLKATIQNHGVIERKVNDCLQRLGVTRNKLSGQALMNCKKNTGKLRYISQKTKHRG